ncbi:hypothetical protein [Nocardia brasiliensis]|uniref:hypothetical protein n=1 Tax=Nocardia brasiliensis TaxID=37326 RepID=UPI001895D2FF|nr:hypothetical protein [Nocardia brasiliensis]MBF6548695.1 hypothetical protein [Nocardia brasiliensis]
MGTDDQLGMDLGVPLEQSAWAKWVDVDRRKAQAQKFMDRIGIQGMPDEFSWFEGAEEAANTVVSEMFPKLELPESEAEPDLVDTFVCFLGEYLTEFAGAEWYDSPVNRELSIYTDVNPALRYQGSKDSTVSELLQDILNHGRELDGRIFTSAMVISHELHLNSL